ncbi:acyltransferase [Longispora sp. NPDC051575]|uniref:acyltransferase family protein n=1 Tax=Longispora sp. NPDC051575 TaxID=3154943 RepID=UPI00341D6EAD
MTNSPAPRPAADPGAGPRLGALDGLRLAAALFVVLFHYTGMNGANWGAGGDGPFPALSGVTRHGWTGVQLFFLISGFVICQSGWGRPLGGFVVSRVARLYPAYWVAVALTAAVVAATTQLPLYMRQLRWSEVVVNLTMVQTPLRVPDVDAPYWSLWPEIQFYLLFALVVWRGVTYRRVVAFCALWTVGTLVAVGSGDGLLTFVSMPAYAPWFIAGMAFHLMHRYRPNLLLWGIVGVSWAQGQYHLKVGPGGWPGLVPALLGTAYFALIAAVALGWLDRVRGRWWVVAGSLTYPLYLIHQAIGWIVIVRLHDAVPHWLLLAGLVAGMLGAAWLIHRFAEVPLGRLLRRRLGQAVEQVRGPGVTPPRQRAAPEPRPERPVAVSDSPCTRDGHLVRSGRRRP